MAKKPEPDPVLSYAEIGRLIGKPRQTVWRWANDGLLKIVRNPSGLPGVKLSEFERFYGSSELAVTKPLPKPEAPKPKAATKPKPAAKPKTTAAAENKSD